MKSIIMLTALVLSLACLCGVQNANAQLELTLGGGLNTPLADYSDQANPGYALTAGLGYRFMPLVVLGFETTYNGNSASDEASAGLADGYSMSSSILQYSALLKLMIPAAGQYVYAKGSIGNYRGSAKVTGPGVDESLSFTDPGFGLGAGFMIKGGNNTSLFADVTYHSVAFGDGDGNTNYVAYMVGAMISFDLFKKDLRDDLQADLDKLND